MPSTLTTSTSQVPHTLMWPSVEELRQAEALTYARIAQVSQAYVAALAWMQLQVNTAATSATFVLSRTGSTLALLIAGAHPPKFVPIEVPGLKLDVRPHFGRAAATRAVRRMSSPSAVVAKTPAAIAALHADLAAVHLLRSIITAFPDSYSDLASVSLLQVDGEVAISELFGHDGESVRTSAYMPAISSHIGRFLEPAGEPVPVVDLIGRLAL